LADDANLVKRRARRRLVGAIALMVLIVVVLPVILDQQPRPVPQALSVQIPSQDGGPFKTRVLPPLQSTLWRRRRVNRRRLRKMRRRERHKPSPSLPPGLALRRRRARGPRTKSAQRPKWPRLAAPRRC